MSSDGHMPLSRPARTRQIATSRRVSRRTAHPRTRPRWARAGGPAAARSPLDRVQAIGTLLVGIAAVVSGIAAVGALIFTSLSIRATDEQLQIAEQGQITDRYNAAITNLGSTSEDVRLGGIYALQRIMQDSPRDQPTVIAVLCAFVRDHANIVTAKSAPVSASLGFSPVSVHPPTDIQAALTVVGTRNTAHDGTTTVVDFSDTNLDGATLEGAQLADANLDGAILASANLSGADLANASLYGADLTGAILYADLSGADLIRANLNNAYLIDADLSRAQLVGAHLDYAELADANLSRANLFLANLSGADFSDANLTAATLSGATLSGADLGHADLTAVNLAGVNLSGADLLGAKGLQPGILRSPSAGAPAPSSSKGSR